MANETARKLRKSMTSQEVKLWVRLREFRSRGFHFRRQIPLEGYIVDFACLRARLIVEVDGGQHGHGRHKRRDRIRDAKLQSSGFQILRIWNNDVDENLRGVLEEILHNLEQK